LLRDARGRNADVLLLLCDGRDPGIGAVKPIFLVLAPVISLDSGLRRDLYLRAIGLVGEWRG
jgi:hypothetical protein